MRLTQTILLLIVAGLAREAQGQVPHARVRRLPHSYVLRGTVRDSSTGKPVVGAQIWPYLKAWGAVTDAAGHYKLRWRGRAETTFIVRLCNGRNLAELHVDFFRDSLVRRNVVIPAIGQPDCRPSERLPWVVDGRDTTSFRGHYIYSWEGGGWLEACGGARYTPDWDSALGRRLRTRQQTEGQVTFVEFRGRVAPDHLNEHIPPGYIIAYDPGPLFLVSQVAAVQDPTPTDCK